MKYLDLKNRIKIISTDIRKMKASRKSHEYGYVPGLEEKRRMAHHLFIAYGILRNKPHVPNALERDDVNKTLINFLIKEYTHEDVRTGTD